MRLKTKLVLAITGLVFLVVCTLSWIFLGQLLRQRMSQAYSANDMVAHQILFATRGALETNIRGPRVDPNDPTSVRAAAAQALRSDPALTALMDSAIRYSPTVFDVVDRRQRRSRVLEYRSHQRRPPAAPSPGIRGAGKRRLAAAARSRLRTASRLQRDLAGGTQLRALRHHPRRGSYYLPAFRGRTVADRRADAISAWRSFAP